MNVSRRNMLTAAAGGIATVTAAATGYAQNDAPQPRRPGHGGTDPGPRNLLLDGQNPDLLVPPSTDHGTLPNLRFPFSDAHVRQESGGWTRQVTVRELGISKGVAGVNMRLNAGGVRELAWHKAAVWAYMVYVSARMPGAGASDKIAAATVSQTFSHRMMAQQPIKTKSGTVRITDTSVFPASKTISAALVEVQPGGMREMHWHPNTDEWQYYIEGQ